MFLDTACPVTLWRMPGTYCWTFVMIRDFKLSSMTASQETRNHWFKSQDAMPR